MHSDIKVFVDRQQGGGVGRAAQVDNHGADICIVGGDVGIVVLATAIGIEALIVFKIPPFS